MFATFPFKRLTWLSNAVLCPDQFWINRTNFGIIFGPAGPHLVAKIGPAGPIFPPDQIFRDTPRDLFFMPARWPPEL